MVDKVIPKEIIDAVTKNLKDRRIVSEASISHPIAQELPEKFEEFTMPIPSLTTKEAQGQTAAKTDNSFENVFSKLVGDAPSKHNEKKSNPV